MDKLRRKSARYNMFCETEINSQLTPSSTAEKIQDIREQLEEVLASAYNKRTKRTPRSTRLSPVTREQSIASPSLSIRESKISLTRKCPFPTDYVLADAKLVAYKRFISSLTRIIQDTNQNTHDSFSLSTSLNVQKGTQKRSVAEKGTFFIQKDFFTEPYMYKDQDIYETQCAEKTTYCRPVAYNHDSIAKTVEDNARLQQLVKKLMLAREKEKQNEAWNNYINELKNKHRYNDYQNKESSKLIEKVNEKTVNLIGDSNKIITESWKQPNLCDRVLQDLYEATNTNVCEESNVQRRTWGVPSTSNLYKYANNSFCCPMSSQGRLLMMKKQSRGPGYTLQQPPRYFRGGPIIVEKESRTKNKSSIIKSSGTIRSHERVEMYECRAIQTTDLKPEPILPKSDVNLQESESNLPESETSSKTKINTKNQKNSAVKLKYEQVSSIADKLKNKIKQCREDKKKNSLNQIEQKLDTLIQTFNTFMYELKSKKVLPSVKSEAVSCSSMSNTNKMFKTRSDSYNVLTKQSIVCEVAQQKPHSTLTFPPCPISQHTINDILNEEKDKSDKAKKDIDEILNSQCAVQITIDIPTQEHSTEVTSSFYKRQQEDTIMEEIEPIESDELDKMERSMTAAVNTDPMGILALFRVSAETVKQVLSYVPNLDYVTYLARRQLGNSSAVARYVCNICSATFTRPSALSDHIQGHNVDNSKNCCVCRHVLDRLSHRSGLFECAHCGQVFTRAYCRELHEQSCSMAGSKHASRPRPSLIMLT